MNYITSQEAADKWGLTRRSVQLYCQSGRIPGAINPGKQWLIPEDAEKPLDTRFAENKEVRELEAYHFPVFVYSRAYLSPSELSEDERVLREAQILNLKSELSESVSLCRRLIAESSSPTVRFGAWLTNYSNYMFLGLTSQLPVCIQMMEQICNAATAHKEDYRLLLAFLEYYYQFDRKRFLTIDVSQLSADAIPTYELVVLALAVFSTDDISDSSVRFFEAVCREMELSGIVPVYLVMHGVIATLQSRRGNMDAKLHHIDEACRIAYESGFVRILARCSSVDSDIFVQRLSKIDKKFASSLHSSVNRNRNNWALAYKLHVGSTPALDISFIEIEIGLLLVYKTPIEDIAMLKNIPVKEVRKTIREVCARLGLKSKKELADLIEATFFSVPDEAPAIAMNYEAERE